MTTKDAYALALDALLDKHRAELPTTDSFEQHAVEAACIIDRAMDELEDNAKRLDHDTRGLRRER